MAFSQFSELYTTGRRDRSERSRQGPFERCWRANKDSFSPSILAEINLLMRVQRSGGPEAPFRFGLVSPVENPRGSKQPNPFFPTTASPRTTLVSDKLSSSLTVSRCTDECHSWCHTALPPATLAISPAQPALERSNLRGDFYKLPSVVSSKKDSQLHRERSGTWLRPVSHAPRKDLREGPQPPTRVLQSFVCFEPPPPPEMVEPPQPLSTTAVRKSLEVDDFKGKWRGQVENDAEQLLSPLPVAREESRPSATTEGAPAGETTERKTVDCEEGQRCTDTYLRLYGFGDPLRSRFTRPPAPAKVEAVSLSLSRKAPKPAPTTPPPTEPPTPPAPPPPPPPTAPPTEPPPEAAPPMISRSPTPPPAPPPLEKKKSVRSVSSLIATSRVVEEPPTPPPPPPVEVVKSIPHAKAVLVSRPAPPETPPLEPPKEEAPVKVSVAVSAVPKPEPPNPVEAPAAAPHESAAVSKSQLPAEPSKSKSVESVPEVTRADTDEKARVSTPSGELTKSNAPSKFSMKESIVVQPIATDEDHGPLNDGCNAPEEQLKGSEDDVVVTPQAVVECKRIIQRWTKAEIRITRYQRMYYKFAYASGLGIVKTRTYCLVFHDGEDLDYISLLTSHRTEIAKPENDKDFPKSRINCEFNNSVVLPFDASSPVLRIAVVLIMAKKNEATGSGEFMRRVAGITKPLSVEKYRERMSVLNAWPLFVPQEVMGTTAVPSPTLVGVIFFTINGYSGMDGPPLFPDKVLSPSFDFRVGRPPAADQPPVEKVTPWYEYLNPFKAKKAEVETPKEPQNVKDSMALIPLPAKHKPAYLQLVSPVRSRQKTRPIIELHSIEAPEPVDPKQPYDQGSLLPPSAKAKPRATDMTKHKQLSSSPSNVGSRTPATGVSKSLAGSKVFQTPPASKPAEAAKSAVSASRRAHTRSTGANPSMIHQGDSTSATHSRKMAKDPSPGAPSVSTNPRGGVSKSKADPGAAASAMGKGRVEMSAAPSAASTSASNKVSHNLPEKANPLTPASDAPRTKPAFTNDRPLPTFVTKGAPAKQAQKQPGGR